MRCKSLAKGLGISSVAAVRWNVTPRRYLCPMIGSHASCRLCYFRDMASFDATWALKHRRAAVSGRTPFFCLRRPRIERYTKTKHKCSPHDATACNIQGFILLKSCDMQIGVGFVCSAKKPAFMNSFMALVPTTAAVAVRTTLTSGTQEHRFTVRDVRSHKPKFGCVTRFTSFKSRSSGS